MVSTSGAPTFYSCSPVENRIFFGAKKLNTYEAIKVSDEDCLHKASGQSDHWKKMRHQIQKTTPAIKSTNKTKFLANPDVKRWYKNQARGSLVNADVRLRRLRKFCEDHNMTAMQLAELGIKDTRSVTDLLQDSITDLEEKGLAPQYIKGILTSVKSWLRHFDVEIRRKIRIRDIDSTPTLQDERVPEADELVELFNRASLRQGAIMALMGKAGLRPEVLGNYDATDGLMIKDLPDLVISHGIAAFVQTPAKIIVRKTLSKARHEYHTFLTELGGKSLLSYLNQRILDGETLGPDSPVIAQSKLTRWRGKNAGKKFLRTLVITRDVREAMRPRFKWRPYVLRAYFDTQMLLAESRGRIAHDFRVFFMGHKGSIEAKYTTNKGILPKMLSDEMREAFRRSEEFLDQERRFQDPIARKKEDTKSRIDAINPEQLARVLELLDNMGSGKTGSE